MQSKKFYVYLAAFIGLLGMFIYAKQKGLFFDQALIVENQTTLTIKSVELKLISSDATLSSTLLKSEHIAPQGQIFIPFSSSDVTLKVEIMFENSTKILVDCAYSTKNMTHLLKIISNEQSELNICKSQVF